MLAFESDAFLNVVLRGPEQLNLAEVEIEGSDEETEPHNEEEDDYELVYKDEYDFDLLK